MLDKDVNIGEVYTCKISNRVVLVRVTRSALRCKGWMACNLRTNREIHIKTAGRLRHHVPAESVERVAAIYHK